MNKTLTSLRPPTALRVLDTALWIALPLLGAATVAIAIFGVVLPIFADGSLLVQGWTGSAVIEHTQPSGAVIQQDLSDQAANLVDAGKDEQFVRFLSARVQTRVFGFGPRATLIVATVVDLALAWAALITVRGITRTSLKGEIFTTANSTRIARLGALAILYPVLTTFIGRSVFNTVVNNDKLGVTGFLVDDGVDGTWLWLGVGLLLLALARAFRWGVELQELEAATI